MRHDFSQKQTFSSPFAAIVVSRNVNAWGENDHVR